jgi:cellobiose phosphorylase
MSTASQTSAATRVASASGLVAEFNANGALRRLQCPPVCLSLFIGSEVEGGPANLYLRRLGESMQATPLLGPRSPTHVLLQPLSAGKIGTVPLGLLIGTGSWLGIDYRIELHLGSQSAGWIWSVWLRNGGASAQTLDLTYVQDLALAPYGAVRMNEYYVSQYIDHTPLQHQRLGVLLASRQNQPVDGRHPWSLIGSLRNGVSFATDALQWYERAARAGLPAPGLLAELPGRRLQHEHSMVVIRDAPLRLKSGQASRAGFAGIFLSDHSQASEPADVHHLDEFLRLSTAPAPVAELSAGTTTDHAQLPQGPGAHATLFSHGALLASQPLDESTLQTLYAPPWRHVERDEKGACLSFFHGEDRHVVLQAKELRVLRPHGQLLRTGLHLTPDESALTSTVWMNGVFHSMLAQGHVSINRCFSAVRSYLGLFRAQGQRVFVEIAGVWQLLGIPSAFEMTPQSCRWLYQHEHGVIEVRSGVRHEPHALTLSLEVRSGPPARFLIVQHIALNGDDGAERGAARWQREGLAIRLTAAASSDVGRRFPQGDFLISAVGATQLERVGGDELLFLDGRSREQPYLCVVTAPATRAELRIEGRLIGSPSPAPQRAHSERELIPLLTLEAPAGSACAAQVQRLADIVPWFAQNAWVHYLSPRGLEQYSGGGWGTRDVCQGPVELLLALGEHRAARDVLLRVMAQQNTDGDWPQWFMFFERERQIRAGDSHGDILLWPLVVLAQYLLASGDASVLEESVSFFAAKEGPSEQGSVWEHAQRALALAERRSIAGTSLVSYGHGDWNDSLQPADPRMREHLCSAWTVTLHVQALNSLARALQVIGRTAEAERLQQRSRAVQADFQRLLLIDGTLAGYALFEEGGSVRHLLHPRDELTGVHYSSLAMIHAILEDLFTPSQARAHLSLIETHLSAPDGVRLFDQPLPYHGGRQRLFQRAETATFFGREIGLMYMHAHLRYAQALAHLGEADRFFHALSQATPIGIRELLANATLRQANCYYSSSDAAFADRYQASAEYDRVRDGRIGFDGGWRVYSSGAGIACALILRRFLGLGVEAGSVRIDPVIPTALDGLRARTLLLARPIEIHYRTGRAGSGVQGLRLNGTALTFQREPNPHRSGAALVSEERVRALLSESVNRLEVQLS